MKGEIIAFFGADRKCGTSSVVHSIVERLGTLCPEKCIVFVSCCEDGGTVRISDEGSMETGGACIKDLYPYIAAKAVDMDSLICDSRIRENFHSIGGGDYPENEQVVEPLLLQSFLEELAERTNLLICDCGSEITGGLFLGGMFASKMRICVLSQSEYAIKRLERLGFYYRKLRVEPSMLIVNMYDYIDPCDISYISERMGFPAKDIYSLPVSGSGRQSERDGKSLIAYGEAEYLKSVERICVKILEAKGMEPTAGRRRFPWTGWI